MDIYIYIYIYIYWRLVPCQLFLHSEELLHHLLFLALVSLLCLSDISLKNFHKQLCCMRAEIGFKVYRCSTNPPPPKKKTATTYSLFICVGIHISFFIHPSTPHPQFYYLSIQILSNFCPSFFQPPTSFCAVSRKKWIKFTNKYKLLKSHRI